MPWLITHTSPHGRYSQGGYLFHMPPRWPKSIITRLSPLDWRVRYCGLAAEHLLPKLFGHRLTRALGEFEAENVLEAIERMAKLPQDFMLPEAVHGLRDTGYRKDENDRADRRFRAGVVRGLGWFGRYRRNVDPKLRSVILRTIWDLREFLPDEAAEAFNQISTHEAADYLKELCLEYMHDKDPVEMLGIIGMPGNMVACHCARFIGRIEGRHAIPFFEVVVEQGAVSHALIGTAEALGHIGGLKAFRLLARMIDEELLDPYYVRDEIDRTGLATARAYLLDRFPNIYPYHWKRLEEIRAERLAKEQEEARKEVTS